MTLADPAVFAHKDIVHRGACNICDCRACSFGLHCGPCYRVYREAKLVQWKSQGRPRRHRHRRV